MDSVSSSSHPPRSPQPSNSCQTIIANSGVKFGTSGARGLVTDFTSEVCYAFALAFLSSIQSRFTFTTVAFAIDNRPSSPAMATACIQAAHDLGLATEYYGVCPTPALAFVAMQDQQPCIMITGSHIPFDRNGLKFYRPDGEITKIDEQGILHSQSHIPATMTIAPLPDTNPNGAARYVKRVTDVFSPTLLNGKKIGIFEHSSAGRDIYQGLFEALGAEVVALERTDTFVPIDTEAVGDEDKQKALAWSAEYGFDMIYSTDGDGDRPLLSDEHGHWLRGDIVGLLTAQALGIQALAVPVSCNTAIEASGYFTAVSRTQIGSPYVIAAFPALREHYHAIAGFEANGGFLLGSDITLNDTVIHALPTRDALLPAIMLLSLSIEQRCDISVLVANLPQRFTESDRIQNFATQDSQALLTQLAIDPTSLLTAMGVTESVTAQNTIDGLRLTLSNGDIVHLRPSGNAPELRCYAESHDSQSARQLVTSALACIPHLPCGN
jgi:phosphomannomutase